MSDPGTAFDPIGIVVDWLDACRQRRLADLLKLYADRAILDCCDGGRFVGRSDLHRYWSPKLHAAAEAAFELNDLRIEGDTVIVGYRDYDGADVQTQFWFDIAGNISISRCIPLEDACAASEAA